MTLLIYLKKRKKREEGEREGGREKRDEGERGERRLREGERKERGGKSEFGNNARQTDSQSIHELTDKE